MVEQKDIGKELGLDENARAALSYVLGWASGIVFLLIEKESKHVKFHALQSTIAFLSLHIFLILLHVVMTPLYMFSAWYQMFLILLLVLWIVLIAKAYQGEIFKLPIIGHISHRHTHK